MAQLTYKMTIQYEGSKYKGWQRLKTSDQTIQYKIEQVLSRLFDEDIEIQGSGRTDAGVHARGQVASFKANRNISPNALMRDMNRYLPDDIVVTDLSIASHDFHARFHAKSKNYTYQLWVADHPPVFERNFIWHLEGKTLDLERMKCASNLLIGTHDFSGFSTDKTKKSTIRTIESIDFITEGNVIKIVFVGDGFLYNMVRIIVGTLVEIGLGTRTSDSIQKVFDTNKREFAGETAPAKGLFLMEVFY